MILHSVRVRLVALHLVVIGEVLLLELLIVHKPIIKITRCWHFIILVEHIRFIK